MGHETTIRKEVIMFRKSLTILILFLCLGLLLSGCPKKTVTMDEGALTKEETAAREAERARQEQELKAQEEAARKAEEEAARKAQAEKEFEKSLVAKKTPGIEGEVLESSLLKDIHFDFDKYDIRPQDAEILKGNATLLMKSSTAKIQIEGHCDERGTQEYNLALGERRANSARLYLLSLGIAADRISTISYGEERPLDPGHDEEAWAKNRGCHFVILSK
jgi:peptidoglycan-associated lipoprotein